jgi:hypothetical protein
MAYRRNKDKHARTAAIVGGGALLLWLLIRGKGFGVGHGGAAIGDGSRAGSAPTSRCRVRIDADGIETDGVPTDVRTMTERCRVAGSADVRVTGAAITGVVAEAVQALQAAGVRVYAASDVWNTAHTTPARRSR